MLDIMLDIETLGTGLTPPIIQIAAVPFRLEGLEEDFELFNEFLSLPANKEAGLVPEVQTMEWWLQQSWSAMEVLARASESTLTLPKLLENFQLYLSRLRMREPDSKLRIWGNGSIFDNRILMAAYGKCNLALPWKYNEDRDVRTILDLASITGVDPKTLPFEGTPHNGIDDAKHQIKQVKLVYHSLSHLGF